MIIEYGIIGTDPRSQATTEQLLSNAEERGTALVGVEVITPTLQARHTINIDPQHTGQGSTSSAIWEAFERSFELAEALRGKEVVMTTEKPDLDSVCTMALLTLAMEDPNALNGLDIRIRASRVDAHDNDIATNSEWQPSALADAIQPDTEFGAICPAFPHVSCPKAASV